MSEHSEFLQQLGPDAEGELTPEESRRLASHLADCADCRAAQREELSLLRALDESRVPVADGFSARVMASLPEPEWAARRAPARAAAPRRALAVAAVLFAVLAGLSTLLLTAASGGSPVPGGGLLAALGEMAVAAVVTGAGLLGASWSGLGLAVGELFASAPGTLAAFALLLACLGGLLFAMLRRPRRAAAAAARRSE